MHEIIEIPFENLTDMIGRKRYPNFRNVTSKQEHGHLIFEISAVSNYGSYVFGLLLLSVVFLWGPWILAAAVLRPDPSADLATRAAYCLPFIAFLLLWCFVGARIILKRLSSIELRMEYGVVKWTQRTFRWKNEISVPEEAVTAVVADARWYRKALKLTINGKVYVVDDLLEDDLQLLSRQLRMRLGMAK